MFGFISKKRLEKEIASIFADEDTSKAWSEKNLYYRMGNANALNWLIYRFKLDTKGKGMKK